MYESPNVAIRIRERAKQQGASAKKMLIDLGLGSNTISHLNHGKAISYDRLARIADYLDCSVDYLLNRTDKPEVNR